MQKKICPYVLMSNKITRKGNMSLCSYVYKSHAKDISPFVLMSNKHTQRKHVLLFLCLIKSHTKEKHVLMFFSLYNTRKRNLSFCSYVYITPAKGIMSLCPYV